MKILFALGALVGLGLLSSTTTSAVSGPQFTLNCDELMVELDVEISHPENPGYVLRYGLVGTNYTEVQVPAGVANLHYELMEVDSTFDGTFEAILTTPGNNTLVDKLVVKDAIATCPPTPTNTSTPTNTPEPTATATPTETPDPTSTPGSTSTPNSTSTPDATSTPNTTTAAQPTSTQQASATPAVVPQANQAAEPTLIAEVAGTRSTNSFTPPTTGDAGLK